MNIVTIAVSTGGPKTLREFFRPMPRLNACILLVQHMPRFINDAMVRTLNAESVMDVVLGETGMTLEPGKVVVAPGDRHMRVRHNRTVEVFSAEKVNFVRPSADVTMMSLVKQPGDSLVGVVMTGLGSDGAEGIAHIKALGGRTLAQNRQTCVIFGMPGEAIRTGCVDSVLSPSSIRARLVQWTGTQKMAV